MSYTFDMLNEMSKVYTIRLQRYTDYKFKFVPRPLFLRKREKKCEFEPVKCTIRVKVIYQGGRGGGGGARFTSIIFVQTVFYSCQGQ